MKKTGLLTAILVLAMNFVMADDAERVRSAHTVPTGEKASMPQTGLKATLKESEITLSDGRVFKLYKQQYKFPAASQMSMSNPDGAKVTIEYEDSKNIFSGKIPFVYDVPASKTNEHFKLTVDEGGPDKTWTVNLTHESGFILTIEPVQ